MAEAGSTDQDPLWRQRWMLLASMIGVFAGLAVLVSTHHAQWSWPLFLWGVAVGLAGVAAIAALIRFVSPRGEIPADQRLWLRRRSIIYTGVWIAVGLVCGSISAAFDQAWIDIVGAIYLVLTAGAVALLVFRRRHLLR